MSLDACMCCCTASTCTPLHPYAPMRAPVCPQANSAILNALLTLLNERLFDNGNQRLAAPLLCLVSLGRGRKG